MRKKQNRYRSDKKRRMTIRRGLKAIFRLLLLVCAVVGLSAGLAHSYHAFLDIPWLKIREVEISGNRHIQREQILNAMGVAYNANVLNLRLSDLVRRVGSLPWAKEADVRLDLPGRLIVEVKEREPIALVAADELLLLDKEGALFSRATLEESPGLFLVTGFVGKGLKVGDTLPWEPLGELKRLLPALARARAWLPAEEISECQWHNNEGFVLFVTNRAIPIELGLDDPEEKIDRLQRVFTLLKERQWVDTVTRIDLDYPNRAYVVLARSS